MNHYESARAVQRGRSSTHSAFFAETSMDQQECYGYFTVTVEEAIERAVSGVWDVPDFQRKFVWQPSQVCDLADSLWCEYPIGALLLWFNNPRYRDWTRAGGGLVADGLQRLTSLCLLFGREPRWIRSEGAEFRRRLVRRFRICFDVEAERSPRFVSAESCDTASARPGLIRLERILALNPDREQETERFSQLAAELRARGCCQGLETKEVAERLRCVASIRHRKLLATALYHDRDDAIEIFQRLNSRGMKFRRLLLKLAMEEIPCAIRGLRGYLLP